MNKKYVKHGIASVSTKSQKTKVNVLLTFKNHSSEIFLKKWEKNNVKHGIASGRASSVRIKLVNFNDTLIYWYIAENFRALLALFSEKIK